jgi:hypothetical protein
MTTTKPTTCPAWCTLDHERHSQLHRDTWANDVRAGLIEDTAAARALLERDIAEAVGHSVKFGSGVELDQDAAGQLLIYGPDILEFSAEQARAVADRLIAAADKLDEIAGAS